MGGGLSHTVYNGALINHISEKMDLRKNYRHSRA